MIVHTDEMTRNIKNCVYGMGSNLSGQLGIDPIKKENSESLIPIEPIVINDINYEVKNLVEFE